MRGGGLWSATDRRSACRLRMHVQAYARTPSTRGSQHAARFRVRRCGRVCSSRSARLTASPRSRENQPRAATKSFAHSPSKKWDDGVQAVKFVRTKLLVLGCQYCGTSIEGDTAAPYRSLWRPAPRCRMRIHQRPALRESGHSARRLQAAIAATAVLRQGVIAPPQGLAPGIAGLVDARER